MTLQIAKSVIGDMDYPAAVEAYRQALLAHRFTGNAAPTAHPLVEQAVRRIQYAIEDGKPDDFIADYEIVDDTPPPPGDVERKAVLVSKIMEAQRLAVDAVMPAGKLRLLTLQANDAKILVSQFEAVQQKLAAIEYHGATLEAAIDDLTADQYDTWQMKPFP